MLIDIIKSRRSIRRFKERNIPEDDLEYILNAGRLAPSGGNEQPWLFGVVDDRALIEELAKCCSNQKWICSAPVVVVLCTKRLSDDDMDVEKYRLGKLKDEIYNIDSNVLDIIGAQEHQVLLAAENMCLAATEKGIGSCIVAYMDVYKASRVLRIPNSHLITYLLPLGYSDGEPKAKNTKSLDDIVFRNVYDK